jgi:5'-methylthioadenosine phosphorylase
MVTMSTESPTIALLDGSLVGGEAFQEGLVEDEIVVQTKLGESPRFYRCNYQGVPFYYVYFHGVHYQEPPETAIPKVFMALHQLGIIDVLGGATAGGLKPEYGNGDLFISHDFMDFSHRRPRSILPFIYDENPMTFAHFEQPFSESLRQVLYEEARRIYPGSVYPRGVVCQEEGPRFGTPSESRYMAMLGGDLITHHVVTEAIYARELGMHFGIINAVSNPAPGIGSYTLDTMTEADAKMGPWCRQIFLNAIARIPALKHQRDCEIIHVSPEIFADNEKI